MQQAYNEEWKQLIDFTDYEISNFGRLRSNKFNTTKLMALALNKAGYPHVRLTRKISDIDTKTCKIINRIDVKDFYIHRLVAEYFLDGYMIGYCVDHIDRDKSNNHISNLRWTTHKENMRNKYKYPRVKKSTVHYRNPTGLVFKHKCDSDWVAENYAQWFHVLYINLI